MKGSPQVQSFIKSYEQIHDGDLSKIGLQPKLDAVGNWTEGWGHLMRDFNGRVLTSKRFKNYEQVLKYAKVSNMGEANALLIADLRIFEKGVNHRANICLEQHQFDALLSHAFNCGFSETLYRLINTKPADSKEIKDWFTQRYITANGVPLKGLKYRRNDEYQIWSNAEYNRDYNLSI